MTWLKKDDRYPEHRKIRRLSDGAYRLHDTALHYAAKDETDGLIRTEDIDELQHGRRLRRHIPDLMAAGLWEPVDGGWVLHDFLDWNPSHEQQEAKRAADRKRQQRFRKGGARPTEDEGDGDRHGVTNGVTNAGVTHESQPPVPTRPDPSRPDPSRGVLRVVGGETSSSSSRSVTREPGDA